MMNDTHETLTPTQLRLIAEIEGELYGPEPGSVLRQMAHPNRDSRWWDGMLTTAQEQWEGLPLDARLLACLWGALRANGPSRRDRY
jgi:hypothetical protein